MTICVIIAHSRIDVGMSVSLFMYKCSFVEIYIFANSAVDLVCMNL